MSKCTFCGKEFQQEHGNQIYCSERCREDQKNMLRRIRRANEGKTYSPIRSHSGIKTIEYIQNRVNTKSSKMIYLGGYTNDQGKIYIMCSDCGNVFSRSTRILRPSSQKTIQCDYCNNLLLTIKANEKQTELQEAEERKARIKAERELQKILSHYRICKRCGKQFQADRNQVYCSKLCYKRQANSDKEHLRRIRIKSKPHDTISLELLYKRDNGKCWICNRLCDWNDKYIKNGAQVTGQNHPSIDHVVALSIGGTHTWDNVRLAHMKCNTDKSNKIYIAGTDSQLRLVL